MRANEFAPTGSVGCRRAGFIRPPTMRANEFAPTKSVGCRRAGFIRPPCSANHDRRGAGEPSDRVPVPVDAQPRIGRRISATVADLEPALRDRLELRNVFDPAAVRYSAAEP